MKEKITIGTRGSKLALVQTDMVKNLLLAKYPQLDIAIKIIQTSGDLNKDAVLAEIGGKELFTKEIDEAVMAGEVDIAVHSLKDVAGILSTKQKIYATLPRADARDCLLGAKSIISLRQNAIVGTSSPRRKAQLLALRPDLEIVHYRGNVPTRISKLSEVDATLLAVAGIKRLDIEVEMSPISTDEILPAAGQGIIAIMGREDNDEVAEMLAAINHEESYICAIAERAVLSGYGGNCYTPIAAYAKIEGNIIKLSALIAAEDGNKIYKTSASADVRDAEKMGLEVAKELLANS